MIEAEELAKELIMKHEGLRFGPYMCTSGKTTIGYGRNLEDVGLRPGEAELMLENDLKEITFELGTDIDFYPVFSRMDYIRQAVVIDMIYNLGYAGFKRFKRMHKALKDEDYKEASKEMLDSKWAKQVGKRSQRLARLMENGLD